MTKLILAALVTVTGTATLAHDNKSSTQTKGDMTCISSNGAPNHQMGQFPTRGNPHAFRTQKLTFCFPTNPSLTNKVTRNVKTSGVSVTGVPIRPLTAEYYDPNGRRGFSRNSASGWRMQAMHEPQKLGIDAENAHVDKSGLYHYHGVSDALVASQGGTLIGYAPDGFKIEYRPSIASSSWQLKSGTRPTAPGQTYDGTFEQDFEYKAKSGSLDECNGAMLNGTYTYFATDTYPFFPRCFKGQVNPNFMTRSKR